jgi:hypothetical protein
MNRITRKNGWKLSFFSLVGLAGIICLGATGCARIDRLRGDGFHDNSMGEAVQEAQPNSSKPKEFWSFSNKGRQIEADFPDG